ncbi:MAG: hypothetical protein GXO27_06130 [Chlorobi bacterium]|nr:hypothetical protein [Chlorobiota bacterium]
MAKKHRYTIIPKSVTGDAPKDIIRLYEYGISKKVKLKTWPIYIAKLGHKYYPGESITEQIITDIGKVLEFNMAYTKLCFVGGQIRLLSRYFLKQDEILEHGAELYAAFLKDKMFVDDVERENMIQDFFTIKFTLEVFNEFFQNKNVRSAIKRDFFRLLFFDALVGNNDRHMYNWGIIKPLHEKYPPRFSPIYDSARALFWNQTEFQLKNYYLNHQDRLDKFIHKYAKNSTPKIGLEKDKRLSHFPRKINHFHLVEAYKSEFLRDSFIIDIFEKEKLGTIIDLIDSYKGIITPLRAYFIKKLLEYRYHTLKSILMDD